MGNFSGAVYLTLCAHFLMLGGGGKCPSHRILLRTEFVDTLDVYEIILTTYSIIHPFFSYLTCLTIKAHFGVFKYLSE